MIKTDRSATPKASSGGRTPDPTPRFVTAVADAWWDQYQEDGHTSRAMASDTRFRGSDAGTCSFSLGLSLLERAGLGERSDPPGQADSWRMGIGSMVHDKLEEILPRAFPGATCEVVGITVEGEASFHADVLIEQEITEDRHCSDGDSIAVKPFRTLLELKTINGFGFKTATQGFKSREAEGPRFNAVVQAALAAEAFDCDEVVVGYLSLELVSVKEAARLGLDESQRFAAEWTFTRDEYLPLAEAERARFRWIAATVDAGRMPDRTIPALPTGAVVTDPNNGSWAVLDPATRVPVDMGTTWHCDYCWHRTACRKLHAEAL